MLFQTYDSSEISSIDRLGRVYGVFSVLFITIFIISFSLTLGTITWVYTAEIFDDRSMGFAT